VLGAAPNVEWKRKRKNVDGVGRGEKIADERPRPQIGRPPIGPVHAQHGAADTASVATLAPTKKEHPPKPPTERLCARDTIIATHVLIRTVHERHRRGRRRIAAAVVVAIVV